MPPSYIHFDPDKQVPIAATILSPRLRQVLLDHFHISSLYEMQQKSLHHILSHESRGVTTNDVILCAPTGSGKTLAYALPIIQNLMSRITPRLRAVIVVPTRDLAQQVSQVFDTLCKPLGLSVAVVTGAASVSREARALRQACEILVATPGRLVYHAKHTEGFDMKYVKFLVLDESDRLLHESYDQWLAALIPHVGHHPRTNTSSFPVDKESGNDKYRPRSGLFALAIVPTMAAAAGSDFNSVSDVRVRKILVSATQAQNPTHMVHLDMRHSTIFRVSPGEQKRSDKTQRDKDTSSSIEERYSVPSTLFETGFVVKRIQEKPAALLHLLGWTSPTSIPKKNGQEGDHEKRGAKLVFTNSIDSAHRLCRLLELCAYALGRHQDHIILEMSGELSAERRRDVVSLLLKSGKSQGGEVKTPVIVCSDVLSRGMDIFTVHRVINYDAPIHVRTYLHRAGRTARAGRYGEVSTLLLAKQVHHFRRMVHDADRGEKVVKTCNMRSSEFLNTHVEQVLAKALYGLKRLLGREKLQLLSRENPLPSYALFELKTRCEEEMNDTYHGEHEGYGNEGHGNEGHGNEGHGNEDHGNEDHGNEDHGNEDHGNEGYGNGGENWGDQWQGYGNGVDGSGYHRNDIHHHNPSVLGDMGTEVDRMDESSNPAGNDDVEGGDDTLTHLLYAQIAKNMMT